MIQHWQEYCELLIECKSSVHIHFCSTRHLKAKVEQIVTEKQEKTSQINNYGFIKKKNFLFFLFCLWIMKTNYLSSKKSDQGGVKAFVCGPRSISNRCFLNSLPWKHDSHMRLKFQTEFTRAGAVKRISFPRPRPFPIVNVAFQVFLRCWLSTTNVAEKWEKLGVTVFSGYEYSVLWVVQWC